MRISRVLHDNIVVKIKREPTEIKTKSGLYITGVEQDFHIGEVILTGPGKWETDTTTGKEEFTPTTIKPGDMVVLEKNFHHVYDVRRRDRIDHTINIAKADDEYDYFLTKADDCYLKFDHVEDAKNTEIFGELYSVMTVKEAVTRV